MLAPHVLHLIEMLFGPLTQIAAQLDHRATETLSPPGAFAAADTVDFVAQTTQGTTIRASLSNAATEQTHEWRIAVADGMVLVRNPSIDPVEGFTFTHVGPDGLETRHGEAGAAAGDSRVRPVLRLAARFIAAVRSGAQVSPNLSDAASAQRAVDAILLSDRTSEPVALTVPRHV